MQKSKCNKLMHALEARVSEGFHPSHNLNFDMIHTFLLYRANAKSEIFINKQLTSNAKIFVTPNKPATFQSISLRNLIFRQRAISHHWGKLNGYDKYEPRLKLASHVGWIGVVHGGGRSFGECVATWAIS